MGKTITRHHNKNRCKGGTKEEKNIIHLKQWKHQYWHALFKNKTFGEIGRLLLRVEKMKRRI